MLPMDKENIAELIDEKHRDFINLLKDQLEKAWV